MINLRIVLISIFTIITSLCITYTQSYAETTTSSLSPTPNKTPPLIKASTTPLVIPPPPETTVKGYVLIDGYSGQILAQKNMHNKLAPASLTKLMTIYIIEKALANRQINLNDNVPISKDAWKTGGSRMFIQVGTTVTVRDLIQGIIVASGNDATVAMAEYLAGTEQAFTDIMNQEARTLKLDNTHFTDANGLPNPNHYSSPYDLAILSRAIINDYPQYYGWFKEKFFTYNNINQPNRNRLLWLDPTVDGLKTGFTEDAGYCLAASAKNGDTRLISVVMGAKSVSERVKLTESLLKYGFRFYQTHKVQEANVPITQVRVWYGSDPTLNLGLAKPIYITLPQGRYAKLSKQMTLNQQIKAPVLKGSRQGTLEIILDNNVIGSYPLIALQDDPRAGLWTRLIESIRLWFHKK